MLWAHVSVRCTSLREFDERKVAKVAAAMRAAGFAEDPDRPERACAQDGAECDETTFYVPGRAMSAETLRARAFAAFSEAHESIADMRVTWRTAAGGLLFHRLLERARDERLALCRAPPPGDDARAVRLRGKRRALRDETTEYATEEEFLNYNACVAHGIKEGQ